MEDIVRRRAVFQDRAIEIIEESIMLQPRIIALTVKEPSFLVLDYETGERKLFDVKPYIQGSWYGELGDADYFRTVCLLPG